MTGVEEVTLDIYVRVGDARHGGRYTITRELALNDDLAQGYRGVVEFVGASASYVEKLAEESDDEAVAAILRTFARGLRGDG